MRLYKLLKEHGQGKGEDTMWTSVSTLSEYLDRHEDDLDDYGELLRTIYADMCGRHYDRSLAEEQIAQMYYVDKNGKKHHAPYWTHEQTDAKYEACKGALPREVNEHDFAVTLNMIKSDYYCLLKTWFDASSEDEIDERCVEMACAFLNDVDSDYGDEKIWCYYN